MYRLTKILGFLALFLLVEKLMAQTTINPDSVCVGSTSESYWVPNNPNSTYQWIVDPVTGGNIISGQGTNSIVIDWSTTIIGLYTSAITLIETDNQTSCSGNTSIDVEVIDLPTNIQSVSVTACEGGNIPDLFVLGGTPSSQFMWYSDSGLNNFLGTGTSFSTNQTAVGVYTYYVVEILNGCSGSPVPATLTIDPAPIVDAGIDDDICDGDTYTLSGSGSNNNGYSWSTSGDGVFSNINTVNPIYTPGVNDITNGSVVLTMTATGISPCGDVSDDMILTITPLAIVNAGQDDAICEGNTYTLSGSGSNNNGYIWSTSGDGVFSNANTANPVYTPGVNDITNGSVVLTMTATGISPCGDVSDDMILTITPAAIVNAGIDDVICEGNTYTLSASGLNNNGYTWSTSGDGVFSNINTVNADYTPGANDISNGVVDLTIVAIGNGTCADTTDVMILTIISLPTPGPIQHN